MIESLEKLKDAVQTITFADIYDNSTDDIKELQRLYDDLEDIEIRIYAQLRELKELKAENDRRESNNVS